MNSLNLNSYCIRKKKVVSVLIIPLLWFKRYCLTVKYTCCLNMRVVLKIIQFSTSSFVLIYIGLFFLIFLQPSVFQQETLSISSSWSWFLCILGAMVGGLETGPFSTKTNILHRAQPTLSFSPQRDLDSMLLIYFMNVRYKLWARVFRLSTAFSTFN